MPGDTQYDIWTDWPMHLWRNDAELAGAPRTAEIANASGMFLKIITSHIWGLVATSTGPPVSLDLASCAPHPPGHAGGCGRLGTRPHRALTAGLAAFKPQHNVAQA